MRNNLILLTDSYKLSHYVQYPPKTTKVYSYFEAREGAKFAETVFFGLQYFLLQYMAGQVVSDDMIDTAKAICEKHVGPGIFNEAGWRYIVSKHGGKLPVHIKAVPEGTPVPVGNALMTIENTDPECFWLTNYLETLLSQIWYPSTVATLSRETKKVILKYLEETGDPAGIGFKLHDFGFRGVSSVESAGIGGLAHLVNFMGTDTIAALTCGMDYYQSDVCAFSIPASEHSTITSWGQENEDKAMQNMLEKYPKGLVACVSDSFDIYKAAGKIWGEQLKDLVLQREGCLVIRPDSGDPKEVLPKLISILAGRFGSKLNDKGYMVLNDKVRVIQGDGCNFQSIGEILEILKQNKISADNIAFGMGGGLLQQVNRDTQRFAFKCCSATIDGKEVDVFKSPVTDPLKNSKKGRLSLWKRDVGYRPKFITSATEPVFSTEMLETVFLNGELVKEITFEQVRKNAEI